MAIKLNIEISEDDHAALLEKVAAENKLTAAEYATNIINSWLTSQLRGQYMDIVKVASLSDLKSSLTTLKAKLVTDKVLGG